VRVLIALGTRPEIIKLGPVVREFRRRPGIVTDVFWSGQHVELAAGLFEVFDMSVTFRGEDIVGEVGLAGKLGRMVQRVGEILTKHQYEWVVVQGDTATAAAAATAGFLANVRVAHVEAGLRTGDLRSPWPEEFNRRVISLATSAHLAPTAGAKDNLLSENHPPSSIITTGNTVVDALLFVRHRLGAEYRPRSAALSGLKLKEKLVLVTGHRRENFGEPMRRVLRALKTIASFPDVSIVFPVHLNPVVQQEVFAQLGGRDNIHLIEPLQYPDLVHLMGQSWVIISDSGGIQEEAPTFGVPIVITRESTERPEVVDAGFGQLVGTNEAAIVAAVLPFVEGNRRTVLSGKNPFGDGKASLRIVDHLAKRAETDWPPQQSQVTPARNTLHLRAG
jgi:UDP-N-acetylglucosamine 2-epimerase